MTAAPDTFVVSLPEGWATVPSDPDELIDAVRAAASTDTDDPAFGRTLVLLRRLAQHARADGVVFTAAFSDLIEPDGDPDDFEPLALGAIATLVTHRAADLGVDTLRFEHVQNAVLPAPEDRRVRRLRDPQVVELTAGPAILDVALRDLDGTGADALTVAEYRYHLLVGDGDGFAVLAFLTPNLELVDELGDLFHQVALTLEFVAA